MDKERYDLLESIVASYEGIELVDSTDESIENGNIVFVYNKKIFRMFVGVEDNMMPLVYTTCKDSYPHYIDSKNVKMKSICLFDDTEQIRFLIPIEDKVRMVIQRLLKLENLTPKQIEAEYLKEFPIYWNRECEKNNYDYQFFLEDDTDFAWLNPLFFKDVNSTVLRFSPENVFFNDNNKKINLKHSSALYIKIKHSDGILPPMKGEKWDVSNILNIIANPQIDKISSSAYDELSSVSYSDKFITFIFEINSFYIACDIEFRNKGTAKLLNKIKYETVNVYHRRISRCDYKYLSSQIGNDITLYNKRILLIGCGSLGSYIAEELINCGCTDLTVFDDDSIEYENVFRHQLGAYWNKYNKAKSMAFILEMKHPQIKVTAYKTRFNSKVDIEDFDLIISTVGSSDAQFSFNKIFNEKFSNKPVVYAWLEGDGKSSHALCVYNNKQGCYNCCFVDENGRLIPNRFNKSSPNDTHYIINCCGGVRVEYGTSTLLSATLITLKAIKDAFGGENAEAFVYNYVNDKVTKDSKVLIESCTVCNEN